MRAAANCAVVACVAMVHGGGVFVHVFISAIGAGMRGVAVLRAGRRSDHHRMGMVVVTGITEHNRVARLVPVGCPRCGHALRLTVNGDIVTVSERISAKFGDALRDHDFFQRGAIFKGKVLDQGELAVCTKTYICQGGAAEKANIPSVCKALLCATVTDVSDAQSANKP